MYKKVTQGNSVSVTEGMLPKHSILIQIIYSFFVYFLYYTCNNTSMLKLAIHKVCDYIVHL